MTDDIKAGIENLRNFPINHSYDASNAAEGFIPPKSTTNTNEIGNKLVFAYDNCPNCGKKCTISLSYFCKCGWQQTGNNHEAWLEQIAALQARNKELEKLNSLRITLDYEEKIAALKNQIVYTASGEMKAGEMGLKIQELEKRNAELLKEMEISDKLLKIKSDGIAQVNGCKVHGPECVPGMVDYVKGIEQKLKLAEEALAEVTKEKEFFYRELAKPEDNSPF